MKFKICITYFQYADVQELFPKIGAILKIAKIDTLGSRYNFWLNPQIYITCLLTHNYQVCCLLSYFTHIFQQTELVKLGCSLATYHSEVFQRNFAWEEPKLKIWNHQ
ncbi:hypothetical protein Y1Q_0003145 [Alligator mississippiensis]|uniref:Uncharacterized protein n=1 Tax=Alligator mississippiensis TaxID=8496 RepID=A0A151MDP8_ALLMI|nr:hypothetical protein Y1Q_0003145 [Alligator mississippiensis]